jgi:hypothetical protein
LAVAASDDEPPGLDWDEIHSFGTPGEFRRFERWIKECLDEGVLAEIPVAERYCGATVFQERWFKEVSSGRVWRLVNPDPPFRGVFEKVAARD